MVHFQGVVSHLRNIRFTGAQPRHQRIFWRG